MFTAGLLHNTIAPLNYLFGPDTMRIHMQNISQYLKDIRRVSIYTAIFLKEIKDRKLEAIEDQICELDTNFRKLADKISETEFGTDRYWKDQEVKVSFMYLQDLIFEYPEEDPAILSRRALDSARQVVATLKSELTQ